MLSQLSWTLGELLHRSIKVPSFTGWGLSTEQSGQGLGIVNLVFHVDIRLKFGLEQAKEQMSIQNSVSGLPATGGTIYIRLFSMLNGVSQFTDYTVTASGTPAPATLISPAPGSKLTGTTQLFTWTPGNGVTSYALAVGTSGPGSTQIFNSGWTSAMSASVTGLPSNSSTVYIRLFSRVNGVQQTIDYTVTSF